MEHEKEDRIRFSGAGADFVYRTGYRDRVWRKRWQQRRMALDVILQNERGSKMEKQKYYVSPELEQIRFTAQDVVTQSDEEDWSQGWVWQTKTKKELFVRKKLFFCAVGRSK